MKVSDDHRITIMTCVGGELIDRLIRCIHQDPTFVLKLAQPDFFAGEMRSCSMMAENRGSFSLGKPLVS